MELEQLEKNDAGAVEFWGEWLLASRGDGGWGAGFHIAGVFPKGEQEVGAMSWQAFKKLRDQSGLQPQTGIPPPPGELLVLFTACGGGGLSFSA